MQSIAGAIACNAGSPAQEQENGRALHGAGAEGVPRSASTVWSVMA